MTDENKASIVPLIEINPDIIAKPPKAGKGKTSVYSREEINVMLDKLANVPYRWQALIILAFTVGAREGEIASLEWKHIDFDKNTIYIEQSLSDELGLNLKDTTKTERDRKVKMPKFLSDMMEELHDQEDKTQAIVPYKMTEDDEEHLFIFSNLKGKPIRPDSISQWWRRFTKKYELRHIRFHDLVILRLHFLLMRMFNQRSLAAGWVTPTFKRP